MRLSPFVASFVAALYLATPTQAQFFRMGRAPNGQWKRARLVRRIVACFSSSFGYSSSYGQSPMISRVVVRERHAGADRRILLRHGSPMIQSSAGSG